MKERAMVTINIPDTLATLPWTFWVVVFIILVQLYIWANQ
jgi:hypothetical protein